MAENTTTTVIGADTHIKGEMSFESTARILGHIEGSVVAKGELHIADGAICDASIEAGKVTIDGRVNGNVTARDRVELNSKANLHGDLVAGKLIVAEGASFVGHCRIGPDVIAGETSANNGRASTMAEPKLGATKAQPARAK